MGILPYTQSTQPEGIGEHLNEDPSGARPFKNPEPVVALWSYMHPQLTTKTKAPAVSVSEDTV